jgi:hypothetical protein
MFKKPAVGKHVCITVDNTPSNRTMLAWRPSESVIEGEIVPNETFDPIEGVRLKTKNWSVDNCIIMLHEIKKIELHDGTIPETEEPKYPETGKSWQVIGSKGDIYHVTKYSGGYSCNCPAGNFGRICRHVKKITAKLACD